MPMLPMRGAPEDPNAEVPPGAVLVDDPTGGQAPMPPDAMPPEAMMAGPGGPPGADPAGPPPTDPSQVAMQLARELTMQRQQAHMQVQQQADVMHQQIDAMAEQQIAQIEAIIQSASVGSEVATGPEGLMP